jgi:hypothetical protein
MIQAIFQSELQGYHPFADKSAREKILNDLSDFNNQDYFYPHNLLIAFTSDRYISLPCLSKSPCSPGRMDPLRLSYQFVIHTKISLFHEASINYPRQISAYKIG